MHKLSRHRAIRVFEGFAGYGGASFGLMRSGVRHRVVGYSENDSDSIELYQYNFPNFDLFTGGFPCQPFSTVGKRQG